MNWFYAEAGQQRGPVSEEQLHELVRSEKIHPTTLVWREGMANWEPFSSLPQSRQASSLPQEPSPVLAPPFEPAAPPPGSTAVCAECGRTFASSEVLRLHNSWVCAGCKPLFLQRMLEGAAPPPSSGVWRSKKDVVAAKGASFPNRCVKCNAPVQSFRLKRNLYWYPPWVILLILFSLLIGAIVAMIMRKNAKIEIGLCEVHRSKRVRNMIVGTILTVLGIALIMVAVAFEKGGSLVLFSIIVLIAGIVFCVQATVITAKKIDANYVWIKGAGRQFLDSLPEWHL